MEKEFKRLGAIIIDEGFELNGVRYAPIEREERRSSGSSKLALLAAMASSLAAPLHGEIRYERKLPDGINIVVEYGLIQNKRSRLSKWERDMVIGIFEANYRRIGQ